MLTVNGEEIADSLLRDEAAALRPAYYEAMPGGDPVALEIQLREWSRENVIERVLLTQEASRRDVSVQGLIESLQSAVPKPKAKEVSELYAKQRHTFQTPELIHVAHLIKNVDEAHSEENARASIESAVSELARGVAFAKVADRYSDCPGNGGDLGWFPRGQMVPEFDAIVYDLRAGEISPIFRTPFGFHIAQLKGRRPEGIASLADVRQSLEIRILEARRQQALEAFVDALRAQAKVTI